ncbi:MAG: sigma-70 family RNA polymerase sigma factor [Candidatus Omnitrophota bacterium]
MLGDTHRLVERCIKGEDKAWKEFVGRYSGLLRYSARMRLLRSGLAFCQQDIEDIAQGVITEILEKRRLNEVRDRRKITAWLSIMAQTRALNYMRQKKERLLGRDEFYRIENMSAADAGRVDEELMGGLEREIEGLGPREKIILKLNIVYGKTHRETAEFMNLPVNTVSTIIARNKGILREKLKRRGLWAV